MPELDDELLEDELDDAELLDELEEELLAEGAFFESEQAPTESATLIKQASFIAVDHDFWIKPNGISLTPSKSTYKSGPEAQKSLTLE